MVDGSYTIPFVLSIFGVVLIAISGWLGGEMVFKHGVAVDSGPTGTSEKPGAETKAHAA
jgi:hypothetical protein